MKQGNTTDDVPGALPSASVFTPPFPKKANIHAKRALKLLGTHIDSLRITMWCVLEVRWTKCRHQASSYLVYRTRESQANSNIA